MPFELFSSLSRCLHRGLAETLERPGPYYARVSQHTRRKRLPQLETLEYRALMCGDCPEHIGIAAVITSDSPLGPALPSTAGDSANLTASSFEAQAMDMEMGADHVEVTATQIITHHETFARFAANPTNVTVRSGSWSDPSTWSAGPFQHLAIASISRKASQLRMPK